MKSIVAEFHNHCFLIRLSAYPRALATPKASNTTSGGQLEGDMTHDKPPREGRPSPWHRHLREGLSTDCQAEGKVQPAFLGLVAKAVRKVDSASERGEFSFLENKVFQALTSC